jgi:hypothetical protein
MALQPRRNQRAICGVIDLHLFFGLTRCRTANTSDTVFREVGGKYAR